MRHAFDLYETKKHEIGELLSRVPINGPVIEPCCGPGMIARALNERGQPTVTNDLNPAHCCHRSEDARKIEWGREYDRESCWVVTNPPFKVAHEILVNHRRQGFRCAFYLRLTYLEPTLDRWEWLASHPPDGVIILERTNYKEGSGTDSVTRAWMIWGYRMPRPIVVVRPTLKLSRRAARRTAT